MSALKLMEERERRSSSGEDIKVPRVLLVANKCEDGFDVNPIYEALVDVWKKIDSDLFFISGEHGDGLVS